MDPNKSWSENKKTIPQMAIIEVQVPEDAVITTCLLYTSDAADE